MAAPALALRLPLARALATSGRLLLPHRQVGAQAGRRLLATCAPRLHAGSAAPVGRIGPGEEPKIVRSQWPDVAIPELNLADYVWQVRQGHFRA
jgi:hypothetical protein